MLSRSPAVRQALATSLCALLLAAGGAAAKPPKGKPKPSNPPSAATPAPSSTPASQPAKPGPEPPPPGLDAVGEKLWHYQTDAARDSLSPFLDKADANAYVATAYGRVLEQQKSYGDAEARLRKAAALAPGDPAPYVYLGEVLLRQRRDDDAGAAFRQAADAARAKGGADAAYYLGVAQQRLKQYDAAVATLAGARAPQPALIPYQIGVTRAFQENWPAAADQLTAAIGQDSGLAYAYYYRGLAADKLGRKDMLVNDMERFLALAPNAPEADRARAVLRAVKR
ncbi:MAG TPA: tetratricopeptide repeat protein [Thermoanaerobaculia bacterium]|nr:tetratricopeptide repeat protein [Thermoanaerobaculia bacterium]